MSKVFVYEEKLLLAVSSPVLASISLLAYATSPRICSLLTLCQDPMNPLVINWTISLNLWLMRWWRAGRGVFLLIIRHFICLVRALGQPLLVWSVIFPLHGKSHKCQLQGAIFTAAFVIVVTSKHWAERTSIQCIGTCGTKLRYDNKRRSIRMQRVLSSKKCYSQNLGSNGHHCGSCRIEIQLIRSSLMLCIASWKESLHFMSVMSSNLPLLQQTLAKPSHLPLSTHSVLRCLQMANLWKKMT